MHERTDRAELAAYVGVDPVRTEWCAAFVNAVMDALKGTGVRNIDMPLLPDRVYEAFTTRRDISGMPPVKTED